MIRNILLSALVLGLSACADGSNPFEDESTTTETTTDGTSGSDAGTDDSSTTTTTTNTTTSTDSGAPIASDTNVLPGTSNPNPSGAIFRHEARSSDANSSGDGYAESIRYDAAQDLFYVDNLAFDGDGPYTPVLNSDGSRLGIGPFNVFESPASAVDSLTSANINQFENYRALYAVGPSGDTSIAIVRTGAYVEYGFGGFIYQRDGGVTLPTTGQAFYTGTNNYGGLRDFSAQGGLEYVQGDMDVTIDFDDFNDGAAVYGRVENRRVFNMDGDDITQTILTAFGDNVSELPALQFVVQPGVLDANGEISGIARSNHPTQTGLFEDGKYYAILSGENAVNITGIVVVTANDPRFDTTVRETGGFFATRQ